MEQPKNKKGLPGFYIAICCTVLAIGAAGYFTHQTKSGPDDNRSVSTLDDTNGFEAPLYSYYENDADSTEADEADGETFTPPVISEPLQAFEPESVAAEPYEIDNPDVLAASITVNAEEAGLMLDPVPPSAVLTGFSDTTLLYNELYHDWRTHNGVDIAADLGCSVCAAAEGTVKETGTGSYGGYVVIEHVNGITAVYAQLGDISVKEGDTVGAGEVIGTIGESRGENTKEPHLHYEILKDGKYVDPEEY